VLFVARAMLLGAIGLLSVPSKLPANSDVMKPKHWFFVFRDLQDPKEVQRVIDRLPLAKAAGYNGVVLSGNVNEALAPLLRTRAKANGIDLIVAVMGAGRNRNDVEGVPVRDAVFVANGKTATLQPDPTAQLANADFEQASGNHFTGWGFQDDEGVTTFADRTTFHSGHMSLRMESIGKNAANHCRIMQPIHLAPFRQYHVSVWVKTEALAPADLEIKVLTPNAQGSISFQTFPTAPTQDWTRRDIVFNSLDNSAANLYLGTWNGKSGKAWFDDLRIEEIGLVNVLRRSGCPVVVKGESGLTYEEGRDFSPIVDPQFHPWIPYHESPTIQLTPDSRIRPGERLRVSYYHPLVVYQDRINFCLSEPRVFDDWRAEVREVNERLHPAAFLMSHDEIRVMNWCAACQAKKMTPGQLLAWNVRQAAAIIRKERPDAGIWVWNDMFDPMHNAVDHYYAVNGPLFGSWQGLSKDIGIVNWNGGLKGKNCQFFADLGLQQILSGYYDSDEDGTQISEWRANTVKIPGIVGAMYTTWEDKYDALSNWAKRAWPPRNP
jgi:Carbohydrate binding domain